MQLVIVALLSDSEKIAPPILAVLLSKRQLSIETVVLVRVSAPPTEGLNRLAELAVFERKSVLMIFALAFTNVTMVTALLSPMNREFSIVICSIESNCVPPHPINDMPRMLTLATLAKINLAFSLHVILVRIASLLFICSS